MHTRQRKQKNKSLLENFLSKVSQDSKDRVVFDSIRTLSHSKNNHVKISNKTLDKTCRFYSNLSDIAKDNLVNKSLRDSVHEKSNLLESVQKKTKRLLTFIWI